MPFTARTLGSTGIEVGALGLAASYGAGPDAVEYAFDHGVNYLYWGSRRTAGFAEGLRRLESRRNRYALVIQSYSRLATLVPFSLERALRGLHTSYADVLLLGLWGHAVPPRILDACRRLRERGLVRYFALSTHTRKLVPQLATAADYDIFHVRYNAKHTGAEQDIFPCLPATNRPGIVSFTTTSWGQLLDPKRTPQGERTPTATDCYRFALTNPHVDLCLSGPSNMEQTRQAVQAIDLGPLSEDELTWMRRVGGAIYRGQRAAAAS